MSDRLYEFEKRLSQLEIDLKQLQQRMAQPKEAPAHDPVQVEQKRGPGRPKKAE